MIGVTDTAANVPGLGVISGLSYRGRAGTAYNNSWNQNFHWRFNVSYITGSHALKIGANDAIGRHSNESYLLNNLQYRFTNGVPNQLTMRALPNTQRINVDHDFGLFAQDKWTIDRLTVSLGVRYDNFINSFPEQTLGPTPFTPGRNLTFPSTKNVNYRDITPKSQIIYDLFGTGKTAVKASLNKYLQGLGTSGFITGNPNPIAVLPDTSSRTWTDVNRNYVPDCNLLNPGAQDLSATGGDICAAASDAAFGSPRPNTVFDPELLTGWNKRIFNWEFSTSVQHALTDRMSVDIGYFRRWYGNFIVNDNLAVTPADFDRFSVTAPSDARLPNGGNYPVGGFIALKPEKNGQVNNFTTLASNYGNQIEHWNGIDVSLNARLRNGVFAQVGTSTGRTSRDSCDILDDVPEAGLGALLTTVAGGTTPNQGGSANAYCHVDTKWQTQVKGLASYTVPKIGVQLSGTYQYLPGPEVAANFNAASGLTTLGRGFAGNAPFATVNLVEPGQVFEAGLNQLDLRFAKLLRFNNTRTMVSLDLYNATNSNTILTLNNAFTPSATGGQASWIVPTAILQPRFFKISAQFDF
jgi:hypothetical protein